MGTALWEAFWGGFENGLESSSPKASLLLDYGGLYAFAREGEGYFYGPLGAVVQ